MPEQSSLTQQNKDWMAMIIKEAMFAVPTKLRSLAELLLLKLLANYFQQKFWKSI